eukprot:m.12481 g.12481  ORF g.12481 m.12481 type:complete len:62 (+) comp9958_c0_seq2:166-351(+)
MPRDRDNSDAFGHAVAVRGSTVVVGAKREEDYHGVYIFSKNSTVLEGLCMRVPVLADQSRG